MAPSEKSAVLSSWKDIARYLGKGVRTVQRWEAHHGLPVRRPIGAAQKSAVLVYREDVDAWLSTRFSPRVIEQDPAARHQQRTVLARAELRESMRRANELRKAHQTLSTQLSETITLLNKRCVVLLEQSLQSSYNAPISVISSGPVGSTVATNTAG